MEKQLLVQVTLVMDDGEVFEVEALIDTGAQVNLIRRGIIPEKYFGKSMRPRRFVTASKKGMDGGLTDVSCSIFLSGNDMDTCEPLTLECPIVFYDTNLGCEALISYEWLRDNSMDVCCRHHGLQVNSFDDGPKWIPGVCQGPGCSMPCGEVHSVLGKMVRRSKGKVLFFPASVQKGLRVRNHGGLLRSMQFAGSMLPKLRLVWV